MRLNSANRSFLLAVILGVLMGALVICGAVDGVLLPLVTVRVSHDGLRSADVDSLFAAFLFIALVGAGLGLATNSLVRALVASGRLAAQIDKQARALPGDLKAVAAQAGLAGRVVFLENSESFSFAYGMLTPRVTVSRGLLESSSNQELQAVLEHESYHVANLDPLKIMLVRAISAGFFFLPVFEHFRARYMAGCELAADEHAIKSCGKRSLAGALLKAQQGPEWRGIDIVAGISGHSLLEARVSQLESGFRPRPESLGTNALVLSLLIIAVLAGFFMVVVSCLGGEASLYETTGTGIVPPILLGSLICTAPFALTGWVAYLWVALRARRPLRSNE